MKQLKKEIFVIILENINISEKNIYAEIKIRPGDIHPLISSLNSTHKELIFEAITKEYFQANKEHYKNVKK